MHTERKQTVAGLARRIEHCPECLRDENWLFPDVGTLEHWKSVAPVEFAMRQKVKWAREHRKAALAERLDALRSLIHGEMLLDAELRDRELVFLINGAPALTGVFVEQTDADWILAQWKQVARELSGSEEITPERLAKRLRSLRSTSTPEIRTQLIEFGNSVESLNQQIAVAEAQMEDLLFSLYELSPEERRLIETDGRWRNREEAATA